MAWNTWFSNLAEYRIGLNYKHLAPFKHIFTLVVWDDFMASEKSINLLVYTEWSLLDFAKISTLETSRKLEERHGVTNLDIQAVYFVCQVVNT